MTTRRNKSAVLVVAGFPDEVVNFRWHLLKAMVENGCRVIVCTADDDPLAGLGTAAITARLADIGVEHHTVPLARTGSNPLFDLRTVVALYALCRRLKPDVVLYYNAKPVIWGSIAAWLARVPRRIAMMTGLGMGLSNNGEHDGAAAGIARVLYRFALRRDHGVIFQNEDDLKSLLEQGVIPATIPTTVVNGSGVDIDHFQPAPLPEGAVTFLLIARLLRAKGVVEYVEAARLVRQLHAEVRCILVGPFDSHPDAITETDVAAWEEEGVISWLGRIADVREPISRASVYVLPSYHEGTPRTVLEAMAMGRPIITTDAPGCRQTVLEGVNGMLVPVRDAQALALAMERFIQAPELIARMGTRSREIAEERYDVRKVNAAIMEFLGIAGGDSISDSSSNRIGEALDGR